MRSVALLVLALASSVSRGALAQDTGVTEVDPTERARVLFGEGVAHAADGRFEAAADAFRAALDLRPAPAIQYNLARALVELDQSEEAYRLAAAAEADPSASEDVRRDAEILMNQLRSHLAVLRISLGGQADGVRLDARELTPEEVGAPLVVAPGEHHIVGMRAGEEVSHRTLTLRAGVETVVDVSVVATPREAAEQTEVGESEQRPPVAPKRTGLIVGLVGAAVGVVVVVVVIAVVAGGGTQSPVRGDFEPGVIRW